MQPEYDDTHMTFLELLWGPGYLSPGGPDEVRRIVAGLDLSGRRMLDLGCGAGGITVFLAETFRPASIIGFDVEEPAIQRANARRASLAPELAARIRFQRGDPGPLPFADAAFDIVFSKDALVHIADKEAVFAEIFRVLAPGGIVAASDWLIGHDGEPSQAMKDYLAAEGLSFGMASPDRYRRALEKAGFTDVATTSRNAWYREEAASEVARLSGPLRNQAERLVGREFVAKNIRTWQAMLPVLETGEHCPTHIRALKPRS